MSAVMAAGGLVGTYWGYQLLTHPVEAKPVDANRTPEINNDHTLVVSPTPTPSPLQIPMTPTLETPTLEPTNPINVENEFKIGDFDFGPFKITVPSETSKILFQVTQDETFNFDQPLYQTGQDWSDLDLNTFELSSYRKYGKNAYFVVRTSTPDVMMVVAHSDIPFLFPGEIARMVGTRITTDNDGTQHLDPHLVGQPLEIRSNSSPDKIYQAEIVGAVNITNDQFNNGPKTGNKDAQGNDIRLPVKGLDGTRPGSPFALILPNLGIPPEIISFRTEGVNGDNRKSFIMALAACQSADLSVKPHLDASGKYLVPELNSQLMSIVFIRVYLP